MSEITISRDEWDQYKEVQDSGAWNMFTPQARAETSLSKDKWLYIIKNYNELTLIHEGETE